MCCFSVCSTLSHLHLPSSDLHIHCHFLEEALNKLCPPSFAFLHQSVLSLGSINYLYYYLFSVYFSHQPVGTGKAGMGLIWSLLDRTTFNNPVSGAGEPGTLPSPDSVWDPCPSCCHHCVQRKATKWHRSLGLGFHAPWLLPL